MDIDKIKEEMTPELACELIGHVVEEMKDTNKIDIVKKINDSKHGYLTLPEILQKQKKDVKELVKLGILRKEANPSFSVRSDIYMLTDFAKQLFDIPANDKGD